MPEITAYSFNDLNGVIYQEEYGDYAFVGQGIGNVIVSMASDKTIHDLGADGSVMVSKMPGNNGTITINVQQTSETHRWLLGLYNYLLNANTDQWAGISCTLRNVIDGTSHVARGMSFQKAPDKQYQAQGQQVSWVLMAADIQHLTA